MKIFPTILTAAFIAGSCTIAMAQGGSGSAGNSGGAESDTTARPAAPLGADANPSAPGARTGAGNPDGAPMAGGRPGMVTAPVAGRPANGERSTNPGNAVGPQDPANNSNSGTGGGDSGGK